MKILVLSPVDPATLARLQGRHDVTVAYGAQGEELTAALADREVVVLRSGVQLTRHALKEAPSLRLVVRAGSGLDNIDLVAAEALTLRVVRVPGASAQPVAELTFALLLAVARHVVHADALLRQGRWPKSELGGSLLAGRTLGVVGAGAIGGRVGAMGAAWGMRVLGCVGEGNGRTAGDLAARGVTLAPFDTVVAEADYLCLHVPLDEHTHHLVDAGVLARMRPGSFLVNMARGGVVDEAALYDELVAGRTLRGAALDVHETEGEGTVPRLARLPNVVLTPHIGAMALDSQRLIGERVEELLTAFADDRLDEAATTAELVL